MFGKYINWASFQILNTVFLKPNKFGLREHVNWLIQSVFSITERLFTKSMLRTIKNYLHDNNYKQTVNNDFIKERSKYGKLPAY